MPSDIYEALKREWADTLRYANKVDYIGALEVNVRLNTAEFFQLEGDDLDWDNPVPYSVSQDVSIKMARAAAGKHKDDKIIKPVVRLDTEGTHITDVGIPIWDTISHSNLKAFENIGEDLSLEAVTAWKAAEIVNNAFLDAQIQGPPCPMAGYAPRLRPFRESIRETMAEAEASISVSDLAYDDAWRIAIIADALLTDCQKHSQWSSNIQMWQTEEATATLDVMVSERNLHIAELEGDETEITKRMEVLQDAREIQAMTQKGARNAEMTTAVALA